jgi:hypothetical protein
MPKTRRNPKRKGKLKNFKMKEKHKAFFKFDKIGREMRFNATMEDVKARAEVLQKSGAAKSESPGFIKSLFGRKGDK